MRHHRFALAVTLVTFTTLGAACARGPKVINGTTSPGTVATSSTSSASSAMGSTAAAGGASYHVAKRLRLGGEGGWDYLSVDTAAHRLYLSRSTHVMVVDTDRDSVVGDIPNTPGVHGVAVARQFNKGFTSNGRDSSVTVFDLATLATMTVVKVPARNPDAIFYDEGTRRVFTFNGGSATATAIDAATNAVVGTVELGGKPEAEQADGGRIYVNLEDTHEMVTFDPRTLQVLSRLALAPCEEPTGMGIDRARRRLYIGCGNETMAIVDYAANKLLATVPVGRGVDGAGFDASTGTAFTANGGDGTMSLVREDRPGHWAAVGSVPTMRGARTMTVDERTHRVYTVSAEFGETPAPTADRPRPRPPMVPGSFTLLVLEP